MKVPSIELPSESEFHAEQKNNFKAIAGGRILGKERHLQRERKVQVYCVINYEIPVCKINRLVRPTVFVTQIILWWLSAEVIVSHLPSRLPPSVSEWGKWRFGPGKSERNGLKESVIENSNWKRIGIPVRSGAFRQDRTVVDEIGINPSELSIQWSWYNGSSYNKCEMYGK